MAKYRQDIKRRSSMPGSQAVRVRCFRSLLIQRGHTELWLVQKGHTADLGGFRQCADPDPLKPDIKWAKIRCGVFTRMVTYIPVMPGWVPALNTVRGLRCLGCQDASRYVTWPWPGGASNEIVCPTEWEYPPSLLKPLAVFCREQSCNNTLKNVF